MRTQIGVGSLIIFAPNIGIVVEDVRAANLQFLCRSCNSSKGDKTMEEWLD